MGSFRWAVSTNFRQETERNNCKKYKGGGIYISPPWVAVMGTINPDIIDAHTFIILLDVDLRFLPSKTYTSEAFFSLETLTENSRFLFVS
jgi:hypothetical protein